MKWYSVKASRNYPKGLAAYAVLVAIATLKQCELAGGEIHRQDRASRALQNLPLPL